MNSRLLVGMSVALVLGIAAMTVMSRRLDERDTGPEAPGTNATPRAGDPDAWKPRAGEDAAAAAARLEADGRALKARIAELDARIRSARSLLDIRDAWAVSDDGSVVAAGAARGTIRVWSLARAGSAFEISGLPERVTALAFGGTESLYTVGDDGMVKVWSMKSHADVSTERGARIGGGVSVAPGAVSAHAIASTSSSGQFLVVGRSRAFELWDLGQNARLDISNLGGVSSCAVRDATPHILAASLGGVIAFDLDAPRVDSPYEIGFRDPPAIWCLVGNEETGRLAAAPGEDAPTVHSPSNVLRITLATLETEGLLVTLSRPMFGPPAHDHDHGIDDGPLNQKPVLAGWDLATGEQRWERRIAYRATELLEARRASQVVISTPEGIVFCSAKDGTRERVVKSPPHFDVLAPDASVGYTSDGDGNLIVVPLAPK
ncbi:MAG: hypothetical protein K8T90_13700 [Planctomycetes bacterium]|nr:hypothetical protein [Planctomycetota bacterium]